MTLDQLGKAVGASKGFLSKIEGGKQAPSMRLAAKLSAATNGALTLNDFLQPPASILPSPFPAGSNG